MLHFTGRSWDVPPLAEGRNREEEAVDPGPLGLVAERIRLFDHGRGRAWEGASPSAYPWGQGAKERKSRTLGYQDPEGVQKLYQKLSVYSLFGLPRLSEVQRSLWAVGEGLKDLISPQSSWREFVPGHEALTRQQSHLQESIWELLQTEAAYLRNLGIVTDLYMAGVLNLQNSGLLLDVNAGCLFGNLPEIVRAHRAFWEEVCSPFLAQARVRGRLDPAELNRALGTFPSRFQCYRTYCLSEGACLDYAHRTQEANPLFADFVKWAETHSQGRRIRLIDALVKPHQHLTRYPLLLRGVLRRVEGEAARDAISATINTVDHFIRSIDSQMHIRAEQGRLAELADSLQTYEAVDGISEEVDRHLREFSRLDLLQPVSGCGPGCVRSQVRTGPLRMKESRDGKIDVHCLLLTDMFLIAKALKKGKKAKVIRQPLLLDKLVVRKLKDQTSFLLMYINDLRCLVSAHVFQCPTRESCQEWVNSLISTQKRLQVLRTKERCLGRSAHEKPSADGSTAEGSNSLGVKPALEAEEEKQEGSPEEEKTPAIPALLVTAPEGPGPDSGPGLQEGPRRPPLVRRRPRSCSPHLVGAQRLIHLRRGDNGGREGAPEQQGATDPRLGPQDPGYQTPAGTETGSRDPGHRQTRTGEAGPPDPRGQTAPERESGPEPAGAQGEPDSGARKDRGQAGVTEEEQTSSPGSSVQETLQRAKDRETRGPEEEDEPPSPHFLNRKLHSSIQLDCTLSTTDV